MTEVRVPILTKIQNELKAPKNQYNSFGKYNYRNAEDIESAVKPLLKKYGATLYISEDVKQIGDRIYMVETAHYLDKEQDIKVSGWAREPNNRKGMDDSQITGASSSYATKYALGKLFLIDDTKDADSQKPVNRTTRKASSQSAERKKKEQERIKAALEYKVQYGGDKEKLADIIKLEKDGDSQAKLFLDHWRQQDSKNEHAYQFITKLEA